MKRRVDFNPGWVISRGQGTGGVGPPLDKNRSYEKCLNIKKIIRKHARQRKGKYKANYTAKQC